MSLKTEAIILQEKPLREADRLYYILTPGEGKLRVLAKSAGRTRSKLAGHLQPFSCVQLMIGRGKQDHVAGVSILESNASLREDLNKLTLASALVELVLRINVAGQESLEEYKLVKQALRLLNEPSLDNQERSLIVRLFLWKILAQAGWQPDFNRCSISGIINTTGEYHYLPTRGFVSKKHSSSYSLAIPKDLVSFLEKVIQTEDWPSLLTEAKQSDFQDTWTKLSQSYYQDILERPLNSLSLYNYLG